MPSERGREPDRGHRCPHGDDERAEPDRREGDRRRALPAEAVGQLGAEQADGQHHRGVGEEHRTGVVEADVGAVEGEEGRERR